MALLLSLALPCAHSQQPSNAQLAEPALNARVEALLRQMTLAEKVGQLTQYSAGALTGPEAQQSDYARMVAAGEVGSLLNVVGAERANAFQRMAVEKTRLHIPLLFGFDVIHGHRTTFPVPLALAASFDPSLVEATSRMAASEARADGINWVFSPMVDISRDARWGRIVESAGEDPYLGSALARAYVRGYQLGDLSNPASVAASVKHFAAYGAPVAGRDYNEVDMSEETLRQVYLPPYHAAVEAGAATVMSAFNSLNGVPATANRFLLTDLLRREWGFDGMVVSDWGAVGELLSHAVAKDGAAAADEAIVAGVDMDMQSDLYRTQLPGLVQSGRLPEPVVDEAVRRVLRVKFALGLFDHPYATVTVPYVVTPEKRALARKAAEASFVLLKNDPAGSEKLLPLRNPHTIALIGPLADSQVDMLGPWSGSGDPANAITLRAALNRRLAANGSKLLYASGTAILGSSTAGFAQAEQAARQADVVVMALGEAADMSGEAGSRTHLDLPGNQEQLLEAIAATGKPVVLVVFNGHPLALPWAAAHIPAMLEAWFPGIEAGTALTETLFGDANPSGKLPVDLPRSVGQEPLYYAQLPTGRPAGAMKLAIPPTPDEKYLSRYIDEQNSAQFPFGWGLSYTDFRYTPPMVKQPRLSLASLEEARGSGKAAFQIAADVTNTGTVAGSAVVQLYLRDTVASIERPLRELKGFQRISLAPGETRHLVFNLGFDELSFYNRDLKRVVEPAKFLVWVGGDSLAAQQGSFEVVP